MSLWRNRDFLKLWMGQAISEVGSRVSREGIPLTAVMVLSATPAQMGVLTAAAGMMAVVAGPFAGVIADRQRRRPLMILADVGRAALLAVVPLAWYQGWLSMSLLLGVAAVAGALTVLFDVSYPAYVPALAGKEELLSANSKLALTLSVAEVTGPALTGMLVKLLTAPIAILLDSLSFLASAVSLLWIRTPEAPVSQGHDHDISWHEISAGFRFVFRHPLLRPLALRTATVALAWGFFATLYVLYAIQHLKMSTVSLGIVISLGGIGNLAGALLAQRLGAHVGTGRLLIGAALWQGLAATLIPMAGSPDWTAVAFLGASQLFGDVAFPLYNIHDMTIRQMVSPPAVLGRVNACMQLLLKGLMPLGAVCGGTLASVIGVRATLTVSAIGMVASCLWLVFSPLRKMGRGVEVV